MLVSIVIPCYNSEHTIERVADACAETFAKLKDTDISKKSYRKQANVQANKKWRSQKKRELREKYGPIEHKSISWRSVIKTAFESKR